MTIVTGDRYLESLVRFVENQAGPLIEGSLVLKLNPVGLHYVQSRLEALAELESLLTGAPVDYLRAYVSDLGDHRALEQLRRILRLLTSLKVVSVLPMTVRDPTPLSLLPFGRLKVLELRGCDLSTSAARGLLELRHTLEKMICHNSTDALRHVFASRIAEIKESPLWNRLSFVSCACNGLLLMDESLQLLPAVEILDLSRNKFAKVDNLRKCTRLKHLDLGFNHLRTVASLCEVSSHIVRLVLRNNALSTLRGIERLKSLEGLDLSYNIISNVFELETLADLPSLEILWLEGNPLCSARWYRAQVFSFFPHPEKLKLDEKQICTEEFWKRQIIIASRQKRPASFGFYSPAKDYAELEENTSTSKKKPSRLANIEGEEQRALVSSDEDSVSCDNEIQIKEQNDNSDEEAEIVDLINRIEFMKKERSNLWLQEFKDWMDQIPEIPINGGNSEYNESLMNHKTREKHIKNRRRHKHRGETSRCVSESVQASGDESSTNILDSENSFADASSGFSTQQYFDRIGEAASKFFTGNASEDVVGVSKRIEPIQEHLADSTRARNINFDSFTFREGGRMSAKSSFTTLAAIDDIIESHSSSACPGSPPQYREDILHRRHNLEEEFLQLSAESYSVASSDSNTSHSDDDSSEFGSLIPQVDKSSTDEFLERSVDGHSSVGSYNEKRYNMLKLAQNGFGSEDFGPEKIFGRMDLRSVDLSPESCSSSFAASEHGSEIGRLVKQVEKEKSKRKTVKRVISLSQGDVIGDGIGTSYSLNDSKDAVEDEVDKQVSHGNNFEKSTDKRLSWENGTRTSHTNDSSNLVCGTKSSSVEIDDLVADYFNSNLSDYEGNESCRQYVHCNIMLEEKSGAKEREVAVVLSNEQKLYMLLVDSRLDGSGNYLKLIDRHRLEDVKEVLVCLGLQVLRVHINSGATYMLITRSLEKSRQLLCLMDSFDSPNVYLPRNLEQVQVELFKRHVCGGSNMSIFQYSMLLFWHNKLEEETWLSRSLFVIKGHLLVCVEDLSQFGSLSDDHFPSSYLSLHSCCSVTDVLEMVLEDKEKQCVTLVLKCATSEFCESNTSVEVEKKAKKKTASVPIVWKFKWFSEDDVSRFMAMFKAIHAASTTSPIVVNYVS